MMASSASRIAAAAAAAPLLLLTACGESRSVEAYCDVISDHLTQYESAMSEAISAETILGSFSHGATASAGIQSIWEDAADAAPGEIQTEMELVRDTWNGTLFDEVDSGNLLTAAAEAFGVAEDSYLAHIAVGEYTETHCDAVSGNPAAAQEEPEEAEEETAAEAAEEPGPTEEEPGTEPESEEAEPQEQDVDVLYAGDWQTFGPFLQDPYTATGGTVVRLPGEAAVEIVIADLLPGEDVLNTVFSYGYEAGEDPYLVAVVEIRTPASGLNPAGEHHEALVIDIAEGEPELLSRSELPELDVMVEELSPVSGGVVVLSGEQFTDEGNMAYQTVGIDVHTGELVWETADQLIHHDGDRAGVRVPDSTGDTHCTQEHRVIEIATGDTLSTVVFPEASAVTDEIRWAYCDYSHQQFWTSAVESSDANWVDMDTMVVYDTHSGEVVLTAEHIGELHLDPAAPYGWGILGYYSASSEDQDLQAYDLSSGELVFSLEEERVSELGLQVEALFDGLLYVTTSDEQIVVDLETGEDIGTWEVLPESLWATTTGDYVHMSDGSLHLDWEYDPSSPLSPHHG